MEQNYYINRKNLEIVKLSIGSLGYYDLLPDEELYKIKVFSTIHTSFYDFNLVEQNCSHLLFLAIEDEVKCLCFVWKNNRSNDIIFIKLLICIIGEM